ncbi:hypothetical protein CLV42_103377 [Chitinophaga ginsengisoli]|uniref:Uncharacterized protein n=1 Tax=Chitinophaga ginsengisoli TaxID=363837 RepID=A0A2P8GHE6_9BACT|nr:hypothetical protein CLV42_103377 [Chitinophaga ginsengisoli]
MPVESSWLGYIIQESKIQMMIYECKPSVNNNCAINT